MKKPDKRENINLFFSAFLIIAYIVCAYFFTKFTSSLPPVAGQLITVAVYAVFGLLVFYATRVGDGKAVKRFSPLTLIILVVPSLYIIVASVVKFLPLNNIFAPNETTGAVSVIVILASVALGYGIPYTFVSGFELEKENTENDTDTVLEGGVEADILSEVENEEITEEAVEELKEAEAEAEEAAEEPAEETVEEPAEEPSEE